MTEHKHENEGKKEGDGGASHHAKLDTPDAREARNASDATLQQALDLNPNKHSGSAGGNPDHGSFTLVAVTGNEVSVVASRTAGGSERDYINKENAAQITERELNGRADKGDFNAQLLVKELSELRRKGLSPAEESSEVANILGKATKIFPLREVDAEPPVAEAKKSETGRTTAPHLTPEQERLEKQYGIKISVQGENSEYHLRYGGKDHILFKLPKNDLADAKKQLHQMVLAKEQEITKEYQVTFSKDREDEGPVLDSNLKAMKQHAYGREPRLDELAGIEAGLQHSWPAQFNAANKPVEFIFLQNHHIDGRPIGANYEDGNAPKVYMDPTSANLPATELDKTATDSRSIEYSIIHELTHQTQDRIGWNLPMKGSKPPETIEEHFAKTAGWIKAADGDFYLMGKNGEYYKCDQKDADKWTKYDAHLHAIGPVTTRQARGNALIKPPTDYFKNPKEEMSECLTYYRLGGSYRQQLASNEDPAADHALTKLISSIDQADINKSYPPDAHGQPHFLRADDGSLQLNPSYVAPPKGKPHAKAH